MFKKLIVTGAAAALMLGSAIGAFADYHSFDPGTSVTITGTGTVHNTVNTSANTGYNALSIGGGSVSDNGITTGAASSGVNLQNQVNFNQFSCGCMLGSGSEDGLTLKITGTGTVDNLINTSANTGYNAFSIMAGSSKNHDYSWFEGGNGGSSVSGNWITTGAAASSSVISNVVNTNVFGTTTP
jgi:hypothetical protein